MSTTPAPDYLCGLDLGQAADPSALAVVERRWVPVPQTGRLLPHLDVRHLQRWPLGSSYASIARDLADLVKRPPLLRPAVAVDKTGVGQAVMELIRQARPACRLVPVVITAGLAVTPSEDGLGFNVAKVQIVSTLQALLQSRRLRIADVPERDLLVQELTNFRCKVTLAGNNTYEALREGLNDDLCLAVGLACFLACRPVPGRAASAGGRPAGGVPQPRGLGAGPYGFRGGPGSPYGFRDGFPG